MLHPDCIHPHAAAFAGTGAYASDRQHRRRVVPPDAIISACGGAAWRVETIAERIEQPGACRILLAGGGTGGHVYPLFGVLEELSLLLSEKSLRAEASWIGSERIESRIVPEFASRFASSQSSLSLSFQQIDIRFSWRRPTAANLGYYRRHILPIMLGRPFRQALRLMDRLRPQLVLGAGGYVSAPVVWAAQKRGIPYALLQLDNPPGLVNNWFAPQAWRIYCATPAIARAFGGRCSAAKLSVPGYPAQLPRRSSEQARSDLGLSVSQRLLVCMGGSLGAGAVRNALDSLMAALAEDSDSRWRKLAILDVGGERGINASSANFLESGLGRHISMGKSAIDHFHDLAEERYDEREAGAPTYISSGYLDDSMGTLQVASFYMGRSGAATVGELIAAGLPSLLIPDRQHADRQQFGNAQALVARGQGTVIEEQAVSGEAILAWLRGVWDRPRLPAPQPSAAKQIAAELADFLEAAAHA